MPKDYNSEGPEKNHSLNEDDGAMRFYSSPEEQELARLKESLNKSATEKFRTLIGLMKTGNMLKKAIIHHKNDL